MSEAQETLEEAPWDRVEWNRWRESVNKELSEQGDALDAVLEILESVGLGGPLHWETLSAPARGELLAKVADFVAFLERTYLREYSYGELKPCWWRHPAVVWQLTALLASFMLVYNPKAKPSADQSMWHEHHLFPTLDRIRKNDSLRACVQGKHTPIKAARSMIDGDLTSWIDNWKEANDESLLDADSDVAVAAVRDRIGRMHLSADTDNEPHGDAIPGADGPDDADEFTDPDDGVDHRADRGTVDRD
ncbi:DUF4913 domain-containing protein [Demequina sp.]|uniref:DUF4913 domain-containing protein n=1 Tax=Demequina sp. TaxID=2050685 RepID=UPI003D0E13F6